MPANDRALPQNGGLIQAAQAASSWVRARRANWTSAPLTKGVASPAARVTGFDFVPGAAEMLHTAADTIPPPAVSAATLPLAILDRRPNAADAARLWLEMGAPVRRWLVRGALAALLIATAIAGGRYLWNAWPVPPARTAAVEPKPLPSVAAKKSVAARKATGALRVSSIPAGARVLVDGKPRGVTPLTLTGVSPGRHDVALQSDAGTVTRTVTVSANATAVMIDEPIFSGFVTVYSPFDVTVSENGRVLRADDRHQIMLTAGAHELRLINRALGYEALRQVDVKPGDLTTLQLTPDPSSLTVTASDAAEVWLDGTRLGEAPIDAVPVALGAHEIVVKRTAGGERRFNVTIGSKPFSLKADF